MKTNRNLSSGSYRGMIVLHTLTSLVLSLQIPLLAQDSQTATTSQEAVSVSAVSAEATVSDPSATGSVEPVRLDVSDIVQAAPVAASAEGEAMTIPPHVSPVVAYYLPTVDTNASIGIQYPAGSPEFAYLVAGIRPPGGDPRLPPELQPEPVVVITPPEPLVFYERPEAGSKALMMRTTVPNETSTLDQTHTFPPGAFVRGAPAGVISSPADASVVQPRGAVYYREAITTSDGKDVVLNFPPGARLRKTPPPESPR
jgi:hypothetical protein